MIRNFDQTLWVWVIVLSIKTVTIFFLFGGDQYFHVPPVQNKNSNNN